RLGVVILGASGSIGQQALDVIDRHPERFHVLGLVSGSRRVERPAPAVVTATDPDFDARVEDLVTHPACDLVLVAIPGGRALAPTLAALRAHKKVALATKEVLVMAGRLVMAGAHGDAIRPVDSEHSAIWQCLWGEHPDSVSRLTLTATGGPFWSRPALDLASVTVEQALNHPRWSMGPKVTVDSATLMNKALELIEAHHLFAMPLDRIGVVIHPQAIVHSIVEFSDGSAKAQLGNPDMRLPIGLALSYPERLPGTVPPTRFDQLGSLEFHPLDSDRFPAVGLARRAAERGGGWPAVLNAANEEAVRAFLDGAVGFAEIVSLVESALAGFDGSGDALEAILAADRWARDYVRARLGTKTRQ
ncbi:MAG TPA: 1-deoxy-D-xylulose-5-phosphate reductoisomerase, partial [Candidatus Dormibacteraeota bacterium]